MAILTPAMVVLQQTIESGTLTFDWKLISISAIGGGLAYLTKNLFTPSQEVRKV
ncbi:MAG: hypothetical protein ACRCS4_04145 [Flavobacterium sp.]